MSCLSFYVVVNRDCADDHGSGDPWQTVALASCPKVSLASITILAAASWNGRLGNYSGCAIFLLVLPRTDHEAAMSGCASGAWNRRAKNPRLRSFGVRESGDYLCHSSASV